jgi:hypothetical protein
MHYKSVPAKLPTTPPTFNSYTIYSKSFAEKDSIFGRTNVSCIMTTQILTENFRESEFKHTEILEKEMMTPAFLQIFHYK